VLLDALVSDVSPCSPRPQLHALVSFFLPAGTCTWPWNRLGEDCTARPAPVMLLSWRYGRVRCGQSTNIACSCTHIAVLFASLVVTAHRAPFEAGRVGPVAAEWWVLAGWLSGHCSGRLRSLFALAVSLVELSLERCACLQGF
jgi:hypothetical protein